MDEFRLGRFSRKRFLYPEEAARIDALRQERLHHEKQKLNQTHTSALRNAFEREERYRGDVVAAFDALGIDTATLPRHADWIPLEMFDDATKDAFLAAGWAQLYTDGEGRVHPIPATAWIFEEDKPLWVKGTVVDVAAERHWLFRRGDNGGEVRLPRIFICIDAESKIQFAERFLAAHSNRLVCDARQRRFFYVRSMPLTGLDAPSPARRKSLRAACIVGRVAKTSKAFIDAAGKELFQQTINQLLLEEALRRDPNYWAEKHALVPLEAEDSRKGGLVPLTRHTLTVGDEHLSFPVSFSFKEVVKLFCANAFLADEKAVKALRLARVRLSQIKPAITVASLGSYSLDMLRNYLIGLVAGFTATVKSVLRNDVYGPLASFLSMPGLNELVEMRVRDRLRELAEEVGDELHHAFEEFAPPAIRTPPLFLLSLRLIEKRLFLSEKPEKLVEALCSHLESIPNALTAIDAAGEVNDPRHQPARTVRVSTNFTTRFAREITLCAAPLHTFVEELESQVSAVANVPPANALQEIESLALEELLLRTEKRNAEYEALIKRIPAKFFAGLFEVDCGGVLATLRQQVAEFNEGIEQLLQQRGQNDVSALLREYKTKKSRLNEKPASMEELRRLTDYLQTDFLKDIDDLRQQILQILNVYKVLDARKVIVSPEIMAQVWNVYSFPAALLIAREDALAELALTRTNLYKAMSGRQQRFDAELDALDRELQLFISRPSLGPPDGYAHEASSLLAALDENGRTAVTFNAEEALFGKKPTNYGRISAMRQEFLPIADFWRIIARWQLEQPAWLEADWKELDVPGVHAFMEEAGETLRAVVVSLKERAKKDLTPLVKNAERAIREIEMFMPKVALLYALHELEIPLQSIADSLGLAYARTVSAVLPLIELRDAAVRSYITNARKGRDFRKLREGLTSKWRERNAELRPAPRQGFQLIADMGELLKELDEDIRLLNSDVPENARDAAETAAAELEELRHGVQCWENVQRVFFPLRAVFDRDDVAAELPMELNAIRRVDAFYRTFIGSAEKALSRLLQQKNLSLTIDECWAELQVLQREADLFLQPDQQNLTGS